MYPISVLKNRMVHQLPIHVLGRTPSRAGRVSSRGAARAASVLDRLWRVHRNAREMAGLLLAPNLSSHWTRSAGSKKLFLNISVS